jgi:cell division septum initiation protein DivIVA
MLSMKSSKNPPADANQRPAADGSQTAQSVVAERDAKIAELERQLAEERANAATLREASDALRFKTEILEKSYAKQLADTRAKLAALEQTLADQKAHQAEYGADHEETVRLLKETRVELEQVKLDRDQHRAQARRSGWAGPTANSDSCDSAEGTINQLMSGAGWLTKPKAPSGGSNLAAQVAAPEETPVGDLLAPELVFTKKDKDKDAD